MKTEIMKCKVCLILCCFIYINALSNNSFADKLNQDQVYQQGIDAVYDEKYSKAAKLLEKALCTGIYNSQYKNDAYIKLYYMSFILEDQNKRQYYENKCVESIKMFQPIRKDFKIEIRQVAVDYSSVNEKEYENTSWVNPTTPGVIIENPIYVKKNGYNMSNLITKFELKSYLNLNKKRYYYFNLFLNQEGQELFRKISIENINKRLAIIVNGHVYSAPIIREELKGGCMMIASPDKVNTLRLLSIMTLNKNILTN